MPEEPDDDDEEQLSRPPAKQARPAKQAPPAKQAQYAKRQGDPKAKIARDGRRRAAYIVALVAAVAVAGLLVVVLYPSRATYAAEVNGVHISQKALNEQLADIAANSKYVQSINQDGSSPVFGSRPGTYNKAFVAAVLNQAVIAEVIRQQVVAAKGLPTPAEVVAAKTEASESYASGIFSSFRVRYQTVLANVQAVADAFVLIETTNVTSADLKTYYQAHLNEYATEACVRHILVADKDPSGQIDYAASLAGANSIKAQLAAGGDFATLAMKYSQDNGQGGSAAQGGMLTGSASDGCLTNQDLAQLVTPFAQAVVALPVNQLSEPVKTQFGYHLIEVTKRVIEPLDDTVTADIRRQLASGKLNQFVDQARVKINPTFGSFDKTIDPSTGQATGVVPPPGSTGVSATTTITTTSNPPTGG